MPRLSSPDPQIDELLATNVRLQVALQAFIDEGKYTTRRILPGFWQKFLASPHGHKWAKEEGDHLPEPDDMPEPKPVVPKTRTCMNGLCIEIAYCAECSMCPQHCRGHRLVSAPNLTPAPPQDDLFDLLARGLQDRLKPQTTVLDEDRVRALIDYALQAEALHKTHRIVMKKGDEIVQRIDSDLPLPKWFDRVYKQALCRVHTLLVGPRGCGKTVTGELLAKALSLPLYTISLSAGVSEGVLQGWLHPSKVGLLFEYNRSRFVKAYTEGGVVLLDELDAADSNMLMILNAALSNGRWEIPLRGEEAEPLVKHENFVCLAAANTHLHGADRVYVARNQLDGATIDRFRMGRIAIDYDEAMERQAYDPDTVTFGQRLRARCRAQKGWTQDVSTRNIADACKLQQELSLEESWFAFFEDWPDENCDKVGAVRNRDTMSVTLE